MHYIPHNFKYITKPINNNINNIFFFCARNIKIEIEIEKEKYHYESPTIILFQKYGIVQNSCKTRSKKPTKQIHNNLIPLYPPWIFWNRVIIKPRSKLLITLSLDKNSKLTVKYRSIDILLEIIHTSSCVIPIPSRDQFSSNDISHRIVSHLSPIFRFLSIGIPSFLERIVDTEAELRLRDEWNTRRGSR